MLKRDEEEWLSPKEVAARLRVDPETVRRWHRRGIFLAVQAVETGNILVRWPLLFLPVKPG